jgi:hypothetical protein
MPNADLVKELHDRLPDAFTRKLLDGSIQVLDQTTNAVRAHQFAASLRELFSHCLDTLAPGEAVKECAWFEPVESAKGEPTRKQRALYATRGGLSDEFIKDELGIDPATMHGGLGKAFAELNKRAHVRPDTHLEDPAEIELFANSALESVAEVFRTIERFRKQLIEAIERHLGDEAVDSLLRETIQSVDELATHHTIEDVSVGSARVVDITFDTVRYRVKGSLDVELQWGSNSDVRKGDGATLDQTFPFACEILASVGAPFEFDSDETQVIVDTSEWYGNEDEE